MGSVFLSLSLCLLAGASAPLPAPHLQSPRAEVEADFQRDLSEVEELMERRRWDSAYDQLLELLEAHPQRDYVKREALRIEEMTRRCLFWREHDEVHAKSVVSGKLRKYKASTGDLEIDYGPDQLDDFRRRKSRFTFPANFAGPFSIEIRGSRYPNGTFPRFYLFSTSDLVYRIWFGQPQVGSTIYPASIDLFRGEEEIELDEQWTTSLELTGDYRLKARVASNQITVWINGRKVMSGKRDDGPFGVFAFDGLAPSRIERIRISGKVEPSWIAGKIDAAVQKEREEFEAELDLGKHLPDWLLDHSTSPEPEVETEASETLYVESPADEPSQYWDRIQELIEESNITDLEILMGKLPKSAQSDLERNWTLANLADLKGEERKAVAHYAMVCKDKPDYVPARMRLVSLLFDLGEREDAVRELTRMAQDFPADPNVAQFWIYFLMAEERLDEARAFLDQAEDRPELVSLRSMLAKADAGPAFGRRFDFETSHYRVVSDIDKGVCADAARLLEQRYNAYSSRLRRAPRGDDFRFPVFLFSGFAGYGRYIEGDIDHGSPGGSAGMYSRLLKQLLIWNLPDRESMMRTVIHEGFHQYLDTLMPDPPVWFNEGMAEYFEIADYESGRWVEGQINKDHLYTLTSGRYEWYPLYDLVHVRHGKFYANMGISYAQSWAFVHFLRQGGRREKEIFDLLFDNLCEGKSSSEAIAIAFAGEDEKLEGLERRFRDYVQALGE